MKVVPSIQKLIIVNLKGMKNKTKVTSVRLIDKSKIQCYMCHKMSHYKSECPQTRKLEESHLVEDIIVRADEIPTRQEQKEPFLRATQNPAILEGKVDGKSLK